MKKESLEFQEMMKKYKHGREKQPEERDLHIIRDNR